MSKNTEASRIYKSALKNADNCKEIAYGIDYSILEEFCRVCKHPYKIANDRLNKIDANGQLCMFAR